MTWDPKEYSDFKENPYKPFGDHTSYIVDKPNLKVIDLGCYTGELTKKLIRIFQSSSLFMLLKD